MCGIAGIWNLDGAAVSAEAIDRFTDALAHRGPDGRGVWHQREAGIALGHRRLAILDLSETGKQPMSYLGGHFWITYNGEIYNFVELKLELEQKGHRFLGNSDTEVLLAAYAQWGEGMLERLNGMWALAIWDTNRRELFLARDRFGIKPLHYLRVGQLFAFASELKAFRVLSGYQPQVDTDTARVLLHDAFRVEGSQRTLLKSVYRLQAGHCATIKTDGSVRLRRWWNTLEHLPEIPGTLEGQAEHFRELFQDAVRIRMRSDVPLGTCLSGGFDSTAVLCAMAEIGKRNAGADRQASNWQHAFVATFPGAANDERPQAEEAARFAGVEPYIFPIDEAHALGDLDRMLYDFDDVYISMPNAPWLIYRELRRSGIVVSLDGHGADELMGGYKSGASLFLGDAPSIILDPLESVRRVRLLLRQARTGSSTGSAASRILDTLRGVVTYHPSFSPVLSMIRLARRLRRRAVPNADFTIPAPVPDRNEFGLPWEQDALPAHWGSVNRELYLMFHATTLPTILRNFDRASMAHGVEVRMPFMDWRLVTYTMALPDTSKIGETLTKRVARLAMRGRMPEAIRASRVKIGFNSPMPEWLGGSLRPWIEDLLAAVRSDPFVDIEKLRNAYRQHQRAGTFSWSNYASIWLALNYLWFRRSLEIQPGSRA